MPTSPTVYQNPNRGFKIWGPGEIYNPATGLGNEVPNVGDLQFDPMNGFQEVIAVDPITLGSTFKPWNPIPSGNNLSQNDILLGAGPGTQSESFRVNLDTSVVPHKVSIDSRDHMYSADIVSYKLFKGFDISAATGQVISQYYDQSGQFISENVPMELVQNPDGSNVAILAPGTCATMQQFQDGDVLTAVFYDANNGPRSQAQLIVRNTSFIRQLSAVMKYITSIEIVSPFLSNTVSNQLEIPINMPVDSLPMMGQVNYSDGSARQLPIDGTAFQLAGIDDFIATTVGQTVPLTLFYTPAANEASYGTTPAPNQKIYARYTLQTQNVQGAYTPKLYAFPRWVDTTTGYTMEYYLTDLDRQESYYVTPFVNQVQGTPGFNGTLYGQVQNLSVKINLAQVDNVRYSNFTFTTVFAVTLLQPGTASAPTLWNVEEAPGQNPAYGNDLEAVFTYNGVNDWLLDITCGQTSQQQWLNLLYGGLQPLFNAQAEVTAPVPNIVNLIFPTGKLTLPVDQWNTTIGPVGNIIQQGQLLYLEFVFRDTNGDQILGVAALPAFIVQPV